MHSIQTYLRAILILGLLFPGYALTENAHTSIENETSPSAIFGSAEVGSPIALATLDDYRGGAEAISNVSNSSMSTGTVNDTTAVNVSTGWNSITDGAFAHASGLPIVIQNSGANVLIQNSTIVNVQFK